jgi:hypothetical protein
MSVVTLAGCSPEKKANKENFKKAVTEWQQQDGGYLAGTKTLPTSMPVENAPKLVVRNFASLSFAGMVDVIKEQAANSNAGENAQLQYKYSLTESGKKYYTPGKGFKVSNPEDIEIMEFTPPAEDAKEKTKTVVVKYKYKDVPTELGKLVNKDAKVENYDGVSKLILTDKGWKVSVSSN